MSDSFLSKEYCEVEVQQMPILFLQFFSSSHVPMGISFTQIHRQSDCVNLHTFCDFMLW